MAIRMTISISVEQASQAAPDDNSLKAAKKLCAPQKWNQLSRDEQTIWGQIQGSSTYDSAIYLDVMQFKCTCPSFKRPCKHSLALLMCYAQSADCFSEQVLSGKALEWRDKMGEAAVKKAEKQAEKAAKPVDEAARQKRIAAREKKVEQGLEELGRWLQDLAKMGLAQARNQGHQLFGSIESRLVDAQATGLANLINALHSTLYQPDWTLRAAQLTGRLALIVQMWQQRAQLPADVLTELRQLIGFNVSVDDVLATPPMTGHWWVIGSQERETIQGNGRYRRQWLWHSQFNQTALLLDFAFGPMGQFSVGQPVGSQVEAKLHFYPSACPQRALISDAKWLQQADLSTLTTVGYTDFSTALQAQAQALAKNPLQTSLPWLVHQVCLQYEADQLWLCDQHGHAVRVNPMSGSVSHWQVLALSGNQQVTIAGEWDGQSLDLLTLWQGEDMLCL